MPECTANATWTGTVTDGDGTLALDSGAWEGRYATPNEPGATDPEELLGAAHAACFSMTVAYALSQAGYSPQSVDSEATVVLEQGEAGFSIPTIALETRATVPDATEEEFRTVVADAEEACPVSAALAGPDVEVSARLADGAP